MSISERMAPDIEVGELRGAQPRLANVAASPRTSWREVLARRIAITDAVILAITMAVSLALKFGLEIQAVSQGPFDINYPTFAGMITLAWLACLAAFRTRDPRIVGDGLLEYRRVVRATTLMFGALAIASVLFQWDMSRGFLAISFPLGLAGLLLGRSSWRARLRSLRRRGHQLSRVLVVGGPDAAHRLAVKFNRTVDVGMRVAGVWVPDQQSVVSPELNMSGEPVPVMGSECHVIDAIAIADADTVIVTDSEHLGPDGMRELAWQLEGIDVDLVVSPNLVDISAPRMHLGAIDGEPFIHLDRPQYGEAGTALKRTFDVVVAAALLIATSPIVLAAAMTVRLTTPGSALFRQERVGRGGRTFQILKLRSMVDGAEVRHHELAVESGQADSGLFKLQADPRVTSVGRILRRYSIDELPQLVNVIRGDMSLIGPRPPLPREVATYDHREMRRLTVRPGMTGLWQVSGRSDLDWAQTVKLDLYYVENWSMAADLVILFRTVRAVLRSNGAY